MNYHAQEPDPAHSWWRRVGPEPSVGYRHHVGSVRPAGTFLILIALCFLILAAARPAAGTDIATPEDLWLAEDEFLFDPSLHATPGQTVVLDLESARGGGNPNVRNALRLMVEDAGDFQFCIPEDEPHLLRLKLKKVRGPTVLNARRGGHCETVRLEPGRYSLDVYHDGRSVPTGGVTAFFHQPEKVRLSSGLGAANGAPDFIAFRASNNKFVSGPDNQITWQATATSVGPSEVWRMTPKQFQEEPGTFYLLKNVQPTVINNQVPGCSSDVTLYVVPQTSQCSSLPSPFLINDHGGGTFNLVMTSTTPSLQLYSGGVFTRTDGTDNLYYNTGKRFSGETMSWEYKGYDCTTDCDDSTLPLGRGEIALYAECNYKGPAMMFSTDAADMSLYDAADAAKLGIGNNKLSSIRVGPNTLAILHDQAQFGGNSVKVGADVPCLSTTSLGENTTSSLQIEGLIGYIASTNGCTNCVLNGIDLSDDDFSGLDFTNSLFDDATLTNTVFNGGTLDNTHFSGATLAGADFSNADLTCTQFDGTDLTATIFANNALSRDFSCYLNFTGATLDYTYIPLQDWRYLNLSSSIMTNVPESLSSLSEPLDLSGINLSRVKWLSGKTLDGVNLGCHASQEGQTTVCPAPNGKLVCSTLQGTDLTDASLRFSCLDSASMEGAFLSYSNLDGADMSAVQLQNLAGGKAATLEGALMRDVNLSGGANLTAVDASNVNMFSTSSRGVLMDASGLTAPGVNFSGAYLAFVDFSGADAVLQGTNWSNAMLLGSSFDQADLGPDTSGGVNTGRTTTFEGAYMQAVSMDTTTLTDVNFLSTYWDALGSGGSLNLQIPVNNLNFRGYWKDIALPECPSKLSWNSDNLPPQDSTDDSNTCPDGGPGPCDGTWGEPKVDSSEAVFKSAVPPDYPFDPTASAENQCSADFSAPNPMDLCWTESVRELPTPCLPLQ